MKYPESNKSDKADKGGKTAKRSGFFSTYGDSSPHRVMGGGQKKGQKGNITVKAKSGTAAKGKDNSRLVPIQYGMKAKRSELDMGKTKSKQKKDF